MQHFFLSHPYSTPVGILTERVTDSGQTSENWALILEICDTINETDDGPKEAIRAMRKRFVSSAGKDPVAIWHTLFLLETCIRNCGRRFHNQVANKEFLHDFLKLLYPKNEPSQDLQNVVLYMLRSWVEANWDVPGRKEIEKIYNALRHKGIQFPNCFPEGFYKRTVANNVLRNYTRSAAQLNERFSIRNFEIERPTRMHNINQVTPIPKRPEQLCTCGTCQRKATSMGSSAPTRTCSCATHVVNGIPARLDSHVRLRTSITHSQQQQEPLMACSHSHAATAPTTVVPPDRMELDLDGTVRHLSSSQRVKLTEDLSVIDINVNVLNDMLAEMRPDTADEEDLNVMREVYETCRAMHDRVVEFLGQVSDEEVTPSLLQVNDNLTNAFSRYERFERYRQQATQQPSTELLSIGSTEQPRSITGPKALFAITAGEQEQSSSRTRVMPNEDEPLIDIGKEDNEVSSKAQFDVDELAKWVMNRQLTLPSTSLNPFTLNHPAQPEHSLASLTLVPTSVPNTMHPGMNRTPVTTISPLTDSSSNNVPSTNSKKARESSNLLSLQ